MSFSENLQFLRTNAGTTQEQLAEVLGVSRQSVSKWENGSSFPEMETLIRICDLYDTDLDTLLEAIFFPCHLTQVSLFPHYVEIINSLSHWSSLHFYF